LFLFSLILALIRDLIKITYKPNFPKMNIIYNNITEPEWYERVKFLHEIISNEIQNSIDDTEQENYPKAVIAYEFFRLLRGEWFNSSRPPGIIAEGLQKEIFQMENDLREKLESFKSMINQKDERISFYIEEMKKSFNI